MNDFHRIRPFKILAVVMVSVAVVLTVTSLAGPDWVKVTFFKGQHKSWGLWLECWSVHQDFEVCISTDWLAVCAALMFLALLADVFAVFSGAWGFWTKRRTPYVLAAVVSILAILLQTICLVIYPVKFTNEVTSKDEYKAETTKIAFDWTYGIAWGAVVFLIGATFFFCIRLDDENDARPMKSTGSASPTFYSA